MKSKRNTGEATITLQNRRFVMGFIIATSILVFLAILSWKIVEPTTTGEPGGPAVTDESASEEVTGEKAAPLGTEFSPEEMRRMKEEAQKKPLPYDRHQQEDSSVR